MPLPAILAGLSLGRVLLYVGVLATAGWGLYSVYDAIRDKAYGRGRADQMQDERLCIEGSVCEDAALTRAADQARVVAEAVQRAAELAAQAANVKLEQETAARAAAETRLKAAKQSEESAQKRYLEALASNQSCREWSEVIGPCPLE